MRYIVISPRRDGAIGNTVEVSPIGSENRYGVSGIALAKAIIDADRLPKVAADIAVDLDEEFSEWSSEGWHWAIPYYASSLDLSYADACEDYIQEHRSVLEEYAAKTPMPQERTSDGVPIKLSAGKSIRGIPVGKILNRRRTTLVPTGERLNFDLLSEIIVGSTAKLGEFRTSELQSNPLAAMTNFGPSLDLYVIAYDVEGMLPGVYRIDIGSKALIRVDDSISRSMMRKALVGQPAPMAADATIIYVSDVVRHQWRYRHERGLRGLWIDSAKVVNELLWQLAEKGIVPHITPAFHETTVCEILKVPADLTLIPMYAVSFKGPGRYEDD